MSSFNDKVIAIARVYAGAMLELAEARGESEGLLDELRQLARLVASDSTLSAFLSSPLVGTDDRAKALEKTFRGRASDLLVDSLQVLNRKGRIGLLPAIAHVYEEQYNLAHDRVEVRVVSALPLDEGQRQRLRQAVKKRTGREAILEESVDPDLIGGLVVKIGDSKTDASVVTQLRSLSQKLLARASRQIQSGAHVES
jgi:F-type H+-transporting ATPase subunit delta